MKKTAWAVRLGQQMLTFGAGFTAVPWQQDRIVTVQVWTVLLDVLTVYFPKHFATTALLLPGEKGEKQTRQSLSKSHLKTQSAEFCPPGSTADCKLIWSQSYSSSAEMTGRRKLTGSQ